jgi:hypothetical protein
VNFQLALQVLAAHAVEYILVGGVAVVAHGSSLMTQDLDILYRVEANNVQRLLNALLELDAYVYNDPRRLRFGFEHLNNHGHHLNDTKAGRIDALGSIGLNGEVRYEDVAVDALSLDVFGVEVKCISLERLIAVKQALGRPRDHLAVMELQAIQKLKHEL